MKKLKKVLVVGSGGREHALAWKLQQSSRVEKVFIGPGNGGWGDTVSLSTTDPSTILSAVKANDIDLVVVGPDDALAAGVVDELEAAGLAVFGPTKAAARIESSKVFAKKLMAKANIPTSSHHLFSDAESALNYVATADYPLVIKADGLALGKGVYICRARERAEMAINEILVEGKFGASGSQIIVEEFLEGQEVSVHAICDGRSAVLFPASQDYKQAGEGDSGPNTGGMGVIAPVPWVDSRLMDGLNKLVVAPILESLNKESTFKGCLYPGLMINDGSPSVVEYNARFGDPETQVYMRLLKSDLLGLIEASIDGGVSNVKPQWADGYAVCVVLASGGYPVSYEKGMEIEGVSEAEAVEGVVIFHAGTRKEGGRLLTDGGRVLNVTATGPSLEDALTRAYRAADLIQFDKKYMRRDIGYRVI